MAALNGVKSFLLEKFWLPIIDESVHYNPYNTAVYALLFGYAALYLGRPTLEKLDIDVDRRFFVAITPFIFLGGAVRSLKDQDLLNTILLETPFIYIMMFLFTGAALYLSKRVAERTEIPYQIASVSIGTLSLLSVLSLYTYSNFQAIPYFLGVLAVWTVPGGLMTKTFLEEYWNWRYVVPVGAHFFDATTTVTALAFGGEEKHVLASYFIQLFGPGGMFLMKGFVIIPVVYYINREFEGEERDYFLFLVMLLGLALGTRNIISVLA